ncbi:hypothetical protein MLD38_033078 [Melastoma candidum]|uniref:Uncharacterized protein n=1 Tax=Melastoma candidum TaxID=119954 RepID=A0ACB9M677_9MYRT|nr:hypothetical protein MLD38_033078 [Melastoma candidum]
MEISSPSLHFSTASSSSSSFRRSPAPPLTADLLLWERIEIAKWPRLLSVGRSACTLPGRAGSLHRNYRPMTYSCSQRREGTIITARSMNDVYDALAERLISNAVVATSLQSKYIVGLAGPPGSGKSTVASEVVRRVNKLWPRNPHSFDSEASLLDVATILPMDGFHLYRCQLDSMENPEEAHARRGAPWTFDPKRMLKCIKKLKNEGSVYAPSFDHGAGDPLEDDIFISLQHKVVVVEGNYIFLDEGDWTAISSLFDEKWFIDVDIDKAMQRVLKRHVLTGKPPDVAGWRVEYNDRPNAKLIMESKKNADLIVRSIDFQT